MKTDTTNNPGYINLHDAYIAVTRDGRYIASYFGPERACLAAAANDGHVPPEDIVLTSMLSMPLRIASTSQTASAETPAPGPALNDSELAADAGRLLGITSGGYTGVILAMIQDTLTRMYHAGELDGISGPDAVGRATLACLTEYASRAVLPYSEPASRKCLVLMEQSFGRYAERIWPMIAGFAIEEALFRTGPGDRELTDADASLSVGHAIARCLGAAD